MYGSSKIISGTFILRIQLLIIIGVSIQLKFKHFKKCLNNTFHCGFRQWIRCQMHVPFFKRNNLRAFSLFYMFLISIAMWMLSAPPPPPLWRDSHAERKETPWWVMRITKSKYTRGKNAPLSPCMQSTMAVCAVWKGVAFGRELVTTDGRVQFGDDPSHKQIFNSKNICEMNSYGYTDRNGPEAVVNRKNIEPAWCLLLGIFWSFCFLLLLSPRFIFINSNSPDTQ